MIPELCSWAYELATSWLPEWVSFERGDREDPDAVEEVAPVPAPATVQALARAREALAAIERGGSRPRSDGLRRDARFRSPKAPAPGELGIDRLVTRLNEVDVAGLARVEREALRGAAEKLVRRLREPLTG